MKGMKVPPTFPCLDLFVHTGTTVGLDVFVEQPTEISIRILGQLVANPDKSVLQEKDKTSVGPIRQGVQIALGTFGVSEGRHGSLPMRTFPFAFPLDCTLLLIYVKPSEENTGRRLT